MITNKRFQKVIGLIEGLVTDVRRELGEIWEALTTLEKRLKVLESRLHRMDEKDK